MAAPLVPSLRQRCTVVRSMHYENRKFGPCIRACKIVTPVNLNVKLGRRDYLVDIIYHALFIARCNA